MVEEKEETAEEVNAKLKEILQARKGKIPPEIIFGKPK